MKTYRILAAAVAAGLTLGLSACGDARNPLGSDADDKLASETLTETDGSEAPSGNRDGGEAEGNLTDPAGGLPITDQPVTGQPVSTEAIATVADLIERIGASGTTAEETGDVVDQPFFTPVGQVLKVAGQEVQVFVYETVEALKEEARQVGADGFSIGTTMVSWVAPPRFYAVDRFIVLYVGQDEEVIGFLDRLLGSPFAGAGVIFIDPLPPVVVTDGLPVDSDGTVDPAVEPLPVDRDEEPASMPVEPRPIDGAEEPAPTAVEGADIRGEISTFEAVESDDGVVAQILVEGRIEGDTSFDRALVSITARTVVVQPGVATFAAITFRDLTPGRRVQVLFTGPVAESYPVQATARQVVILE